MAWKYNFTFQMTGSGRRMINEWLISRGYNIIEQSSDYMIIETKISNADKILFRDNITSLLIREEQI